VSIAEKFYTMEYGAAPEDAKEAVEWLERHHRRFEEFIGGAWVTPLSGEYQTTSDPSTGEVLAEVAKGNTDDVEAAVAAARKAQPAWAALSGHERARYLYALARQVQKHARGWRFWRRWTTASPSAKAAISTFLWWRGISITTQDGRSFSTRSFRITRRAAWWAK